MLNERQTDGLTDGTDLISSTTDAVGKINWKKIPCPDFVLFSRRPRHHIHYPPALRLSGNGIQIKEGIFRIHPELTYSDLLIQLVLKFEKKISTPKDY